MSDIRTSLHLLIAHKIYRCLVKLKKPFRNLKNVTVEGKKKNLGTFPGTENDIGTN